MSKTRYHTTVQFPSQEDYQRLKALAAMRGTTIGQTIKEMVDNQWKEQQHDAKRAGLPGT